MTERQVWADWIDAGAADADGGAAARSARGLPVLMAPPAESVRYSPGYGHGDAAVAGPGFDLSMRSPDFPQTFIREIHLDLTSPDHRIELVWSGPQANTAPTGSWRSSPGRGKDGVNCDDAATSNVVDSFCTPKGTFRIAGFADHLNRAHTCHYVTWVVHAPRYIGIHSHRDIAFTPRSEGCIRVSLDVAKLIHNNSIAGVTLIHIDGRWRRGED